MILGLNGTSINQQFLNSIFWSGSGALNLFSSKFAYDTYRAVAPTGDGNKAILATPSNIYQYLQDTGSSSALVTGIDGVAVNGIIGTVHNRLQQSDDVSQSPWTGYNVSRTTLGTPVTIEGYGTMTPRRMTPDTSVGQHYVTYGAGVSRIGATTLEAIVKNDGCNRIAIYWGGLPAGGAWFDISTGTVLGTSSGSHTGTIEALGGGIYLIRLQFTQTIDGGANIEIHPLAPSTPSGQFSTTGNGTDGIWIYRVSLSSLAGGIKISTVNKNFFQKSGDLSNALWYYSGATLGSIVSKPTGYALGDARTIAFGSGGLFRQLLSPFQIPAGQNGSIVVFVKSSDTGGASNIRISSNNTVGWNTGFSEKISLTNAWQKIVLDKTIITSGTQAYIIFGTLDAAGNSDATCVGSVDIYMPTIYLQGNTEPVFVDTIFSQSITPARLDFDRGQSENLFPASEIVGGSAWPTRNGTFTTSAVTIDGVPYTRCVATNTDPFCYTSISLGGGTYRMSFSIYGEGSAIGKTGTFRIGAQAIVVTIPSTPQTLSAVFTGITAGTYNCGFELPDTGAAIGDTIYISKASLTIGSSVKQYLKNISTTPLYTQGTPLSQNLISHTTQPAGSAFGTNTTNSIVNGIRRITAPGLGYYTFRPNIDNFQPGCVYRMRIALLATATSNSTKFAAAPRGTYSGSTFISGEKISGPGVFVYSASAPSITGLSLSEPTVVDFIFDGANDVAIYCTEGNNGQANTGQALDIAQCFAWEGVQNFANPPITSGTASSTYPVGGIISEPSATIQPNSINWHSNSSVTLINCTKASGTSGIHLAGVAPTKITATGANWGVLFSHTLSSAQRTVSAWLQRVSGSGNIHLVNGQGTNIITDSTMDTGTGWTVPSGWSIGSGVATATATSGSILSQAAAVAGTWYTITFTWTHTSGTLYARIGSGTARTFTASGTYTILCRAVDTRGLEFYGGSVSGTLDNVTAQALTTTQLSSLTPYMPDPALGSPYALTTTIANPIIGIVGEGSADIINLLACQIEDGAFGTSLVASTTASVTRTGASISSPNVASFTNTEITSKVTWQRLGNATNTGGVLQIDNGTDGTRLLTQTQNALVRHLGAINSAWQITNQDFSHTAGMQVTSAMTRTASNISSTINGANAITTSYPTTVPFTRARFNDSGLAQVPMLISSFAVAQKSTTTTNLQKISSNTL